MVHQNSWDSFFISTSALGCRVSANYCMFWNIVPDQTVKWLLISCFKMPFFFFFLAHKPFLNRTVPYYKPSLAWVMGTWCYITWEKAMCKYKIYLSMQYLPLIQASDLSTSSSCSSVPMSSMRNRWTINCSLNHEGLILFLSRLFFRVLPARRTGVCKNISFTVYIKGIRSVYLEGWGFRGRG